MSNSKIIHAMVLAAGLGMRMRPLSETTPKPMLNVDGKPMIDWALDSLSNAGVRHAVINLHWLGEQIKDHTKQRSNPALSFIEENPILETGGGILNALNHGLLGNGGFYAINADQIWIDGETPALEHLANVWDEEKMDVLLLLQPLLSAKGYDGAGDFNLGSNGRVERRHENSMGELVFTGVQILSPNLFSAPVEQKPGEAFSLNILYDKAIEQGRLFAIVHDGEWLHIGTPENLIKANEYLTANKPVQAPGQPS